MGDIRVFKRTFFVGQVEGYKKGLYGNFGISSRLGDIEEKVTINCAGKFEMAFLSDIMVI